MKRISGRDLAKNRGRNRIWTVRGLWAFLWFTAAFVLAAHSVAPAAKDPIRPPKNSLIVNPAARLSIKYPAALLASFFANVQVNIDPGNLQDDFGPAIAVDDSGKILVVWNVEETGDTGIHFSRSNDGGLTFSPAVRVNDNVTYPPFFDAYQPDIAVDGAGTIYVV